MTLEQFEEEFDNMKVIIQRLPMDTDITFNTAVFNCLFFEYNINKLEDRKTFINYLVEKGKC